MAKRKGIRQQVSAMAASGDSLAKQIQDMLARHKYSSAIRKLQQGLKRDPNQAIEITEVDIHLQQGEYELGRKYYAQAKQAFEKVISTKADDDAYYGLAKCHLGLNESAQALVLFREAFETKKLSKKMSGCYLKLLLLNSEQAEVEALIRGRLSGFMRIICTGRKGRSRCKQTI